MSYFTIGTGAPMSLPRVPTSEALLQTMQCILYYTYFTVHDIRSFDVLRTSLVSKSTYGEPAFRNLPSAELGDSKLLFCLFPLQRTLLHYSFMRYESSSSSENVLDRALESISDAPLLTRCTRQCTQGTLCPIH